MLVVGQSHRPRTGLPAQRCSIAIVPSFCQAVVESVNDEPSEDMGSGESYCTVRSCVPFPRAVGVRKPFGMQQGHEAYLFVLPCVMDPRERWCDMCTAQGMQASGCLGGVLA